MAFRIAALLLITLALAACGSAHKASGSGPTLQSVRRALANQYEWQLRALSASVKVAVTAHRAEEIVVGRNAKSRATATLVSATDHEYCTERPHGTCRLLVNHRTAWIVLIPNQRVPCLGCRPGTQARAFKATWAELVDANSGKSLEGAAVQTG